MKCDLAIRNFTPKSLTSCSYVLSVSACHSIYSFDAYCSIRYIYGEKQMKLLSIKYLGKLEKDYRYFSSGVFWSIFGMLVMLRNVAWEPVECEVTQGLSFGDD